MLKPKFDGNTLAGSAFESARARFGPEGTKMWGQPPSAVRQAKLESDLLEMSVRTLFTELTLPFSENRSFQQDSA